MDIPSVLKWKIARTTNMASSSTQKADETSSAHGSLEAPRSGGSSQATSRHLETKWDTVRKTPIRVLEIAVPSLLQEREAPRLQQGLPVSPTASALWVVAVGRSLVGVSAHSHRLLVTWTFS